MAVTDFTLDLDADDSVGLVGETGSGKTTCVRMVLGLDQPTTGVVRYRGTDLTHLSRADQHDYRQSIQAVLQNPFSSFNPRMSLGRSVAEPLMEQSGHVSAAERRHRVTEALDLVGLNAARVVSAYPHTLSGGQLQRVAIARAMITHPKFLVLDEPVSALDVSIKIQVLNLLKKIQEESGVGVLMVSHDLGAVQQLCQRVVVLLRGHVVERGTVEEIFTNPQHEYTRRLLADALVGAAPGRAMA